VQQIPGTTKEPRPFDCEVIVDIVFDDGLFFFVIKNLGDKPAFKVSVKFDKAIRGVEGTKEISSLPLFRNIEFLAPHKEIATYLDSSGSYFRNRQPERFTLTVSYTDAIAKKKTGTIIHDLSIYREVGYVKKVNVSNEKKHPVNNHKE
jgi:hypothetical protein